MSNEFEKKIEDLFLHKEKIIDSEILENILKVSLKEANVKTVGLKEINEKDILQFLPKFEFTEDVGIQDSLSRQMFDNLIGKTIKELPDLESKIQHLQNFCNNIPDQKKGTSTADILSNLVILKMLINIFSRSSYGSAGMQFEAFIAGLMGGQQTKRDITSNVVDVTFPNGDKYQIKALKDISESFEMSIANMDKHFIEDENNTLNFLIIDKLGRDVSQVTANITGLRFYSGSMSKEQYSQIKPKNPKQSKIMIPREFYKQNLGIIKIEKKILDSYSELLKNNVKTILIEVAKLINNINLFYIQGEPDSGTQGIINANNISKTLAAEPRKK